MNALMMVLLAAAPVVAPIDTVVLFPDRAQVTRATSVTCGQRVKLTFAGVTPAAGADSFRAKCEGGTVEGLRVESRARKDEFAPEVNQLTQKLRSLDLERAALEQQAQRADAQSKLGDRYADVAVTQVSREMAAPQPDPKTWNQGFDAALLAKQQANATRVEVGQKLRALRVQVEEVQQKLAVLEVSSQRSEFVADVVVSCPAGQKAKVELSYLVGGASWSPSYEARADEANGAVEFTTWGELSQRTGESWDKAQLTLSTAVPAQNATPPTRNALLVTATKRPDEKKVLVARTEQVAQAEAGATTPSGGEGLATRAQGLSVQLQIPERATVPGDGTPTRLFVNRTRMKATYAFKAAPKLLPFVFRVATLTNQAPFPLLPGDVSVYRTTGFIARTAQGRIAEGGVFHLTFGVEDSLRAKRVVVEELKRDVGLFGGKKRFSYSYRFELANFGKTATEVELSEHLPVSEVDDVVVSMGEKTTPGSVVNQADGVATWKVKLNPGDKRNVELAYRVDVPNSYDTGGL